MSEIARRFLDAVGDSWRDELHIDQATRAAFSALTVEDGVGIIRFKDWMFPDERRKRDGHPLAAAQDRWSRWDSRLARNQPAAREAVAGWLERQGHERLGIRLRDKRSYFYESVAS